MPIAVTCPKCSSGLNVPDEFAGRTIRCGGCAELFDVPASTSPPPLPVALAPDIPPPLPTQAIPAATPARARVIAATPKPPVAKPIPATIREDREDEPPVERPQAKTGKAFLIVAALLIMGLLGIGVIGYAFVRMTQSFAKAREIDAKRDVGESPKVVPQIPPPKTVEPIPKPPTIPTKVSMPIVPTQPRPNPAPSPIAKIPAAPSPVGMKGLLCYVSFDDVNAREYLSRTKLANEGLISLMPGSQKQAGRFTVRPELDDGPTFMIDASSFADSFRFKDESPFTISLWVNAITNKPTVAFGMMQSTSESSPRLEIKADSRNVSVEFACDPTDSDQKFVRTMVIQRTGMAMSHVAVTRTKEGLLTVYFDGQEAKTEPPGSLKATQPVALTFKNIGFGLKEPRHTAALTLDEFCLFNRDLTSDEIKVLAGQGGSK